MNRQEDEDRVTGEYTVKDRVALGAMLLVPAVMAVGVVVAFAFQGPSETLSEMFSNGLMMWPM